MKKIIYKNKKGQIIKEVKTSTNNFYSDEKSIIGNFKTKEVYKNEVLIQISIFIDDINKHSEILKNEKLKGIELLIGQRIYLENFRHEKLYHYDIRGVLKTIFNEVFDSENNVIVSSFSNDPEKETPYWNGTTKYYYDKAIRPEEPLFECYYNDSGKLIPITIDIKELDLGDHDGTWVYDNEEGINELIKIFKMSKSLAQFYTSSNILPR